jgi:hypothetical protein
MARRYLRDEFHAQLVASVGDGANYSLGGTRLMDLGLWA